MTAPTSDVFVTFWGIRGSTPVPGPDTVRYGGNTPCVEVRTKNSLLVLDAGTGIQSFGRNIRASRSGPIKMNLFLTHTHWDHIQGLPFFQMAYDPRNEINIVGPKRDGAPLIDCLERQMLPPNFPVPFSALQGVKSVIEMAAGERRQFGDALVTAQMLNHPNDSMGYHIQCDDKALAYCLDHEHGDAKDIHPGLAALAQDADMLVFDAAYSDAEYPSFRGWGHSTWQEGLKTAELLNVKTLVLAGFNPGVVDGDLDLIKAQVESMPGQTIVAVEGLTHRL